MTTNEAIEFFGTRAELARALDIYAGAISQWGDEPPRARQWQLQVLTEGKLKVTKDANPFSGKAKA